MTTGIQASCSDTHAVCAGEVYKAKSICCSSSLLVVKVANTGQPDVCTHANALDRLGFPPVQEVRQTQLLSLPVHIVVGATTMKALYNKLHCDSI